MTPFFGGQMSIFVNEDHLDGDYKFGIRGGYNFTKNIGLEFAYSEVKTVHDPGNRQVNLYQYGGDLLYHFRPDKKLVPFIAAGFGAYQVESQDATPDRHTASFDFGGGVKYFLTSWIALRGDFRHTVVFDNGDQHFEGTLGLTFQIGGH